MRSILKNRISSKSFRRLGRPDWHVKKSSVDRGKVAPRETVPIIWSPSQLSLSFGESLQCVLMSRPERISSEPVSPEHLASAKYVSRGKIELVFQDGLHALLDVKRLGMPTGKIDWKTCAAMLDGSSIVVSTPKGEKIPIDSGSLRYLVDPDYATKMDEALSAVRLSRDELAEISGNAPPLNEVADCDGGNVVRSRWK